MFFFVLINSEAVRKGGKNLICLGGFFPSQIWLGFSAYNILWHTKEIIDIFHQSKVEMFLLYFLNLALIIFLQKTTLGEKPV